MIHDPCSMTIDGISLSNRPCLIRIELLDACRNTRGVRSQILLIDLTILADDERHHTGIPVLGRVRDKRESLREFPVCHVAHRTAARVLALARQDSVVVTVKWDSLCPFLIAFSCCLRDQRSNRTRGLAWTCLPVQTVVLSFIAQDLLCVLLRAVLIVCRGCVFILCVHQRSKCSYREGLIASDSTEQDFLLSFGRIEEPDVVFLHDRNRERPVFRSDIKCHRLVGLGDEPVHLFVFLHGQLAIALICDRITGCEQFFTFWTENLHQCIRVSGLCRIEHCSSRFAG